jgi:mevalonate kinase
MKIVKVSAPGKLILLGDHAVVYNRPCIATSIDQRMYLTAEIINEENLTIDAPEVNIFNYSKNIHNLTKGEIPKGVEYVEHCVTNIFNKFKISSGIKITTKSDFNSLVGFGSSSASAVCTVKALSTLFDLKLNNKEIFDLAYKSVIDIKGIGSGYDIATAVYGGTIYFVNGGKKIEPLKIKNLQLIVGYTGIKVDTALVVKELAIRMKDYPDVLNCIYDNISNLVEKSKLCLLKGDIKEFGFLMNINQGYLDALGVNSKILSNLIYSTRENGAWGSKLSGAGIGDCMFAVAPTDKRVGIIKGIEENGGKFIDLKANVQGIRIE